MKVYPCVIACYPFCPTLDRNTQTPQKHHLSRDKTLQIHTLRSAGLTYEAIACQLSITVRQAQYACTRSHPTPSKRSGRPGTLSNEQKTELIDYVCQSKLTRRLSYLHLSLAFEHWHRSYPGSATPPAQRHPFDEIIKIPYSSPINNRNDW